MSKFMRMFGGRSVCVLALILASGGALTVSGTAAHAGKANDTLVYASDSEVENLSPYHNNVREGVIIARHVWDTLIYRDDKTGQFRPMLATKWTWVDQVTLELELRKGVTFHNGDAFNADDVVFTFNYVITPESKVVTKQTVDWIKSAEKIDEYKVRIHLKKPFPAALDYLSGPLPILPSKYFQKVGLDGFAKAPIGTGPYRIVSATSGKNVLMEKNANYWKDSPVGVPSIGKLEFRVIPDAETRLAELMTGGVDWIWRVPVDQAKQLGKAPKITVLTGESMRVGFLQFDSIGASDPNSPLKDVRVRQAISYAIDRKAMVDNLVGTGSRIMNSACFIEQIACSDASVVKYEYNPAKAKALLAEAGYPNGFSIEFYAYREREYAEAVISYLAAVGIKANLNYVKFATLREQNRAGKIPVAFQTWASLSVNDASAFTGVWFQGNDDDRSRDKAVSELLAKADASADPEARKKMYAEALKIISEKAYMLPMFSYPTTYAFSSDLVFEAQKDELPRFFTAHWK